MSDLAPVKNNSGAVSVPNHPPEYQNEVLHSDVLIPKLLLAQGLSKAVSSRQVTQGDIYRTIPIEVVGGPDKPVTIIPLIMKNKWILAQLEGSKFIYRGMEERNVFNENADWEYMLDGKKWKRTKCLELYALLESDVVKEEKAMEEFTKTGNLTSLNDTLLPIVIRFSSTSFNAGQKVATHFVKARGLSQKIGKTVHPHGYGLSLRSKQQSNDLGTFYVFDIESGGPVTPQAVKAASDWIQTLTTKDVKVDDTDDVPSQPIGPDQF